jgi:hypothetical protein
MYQENRTLLEPVVFTWNIVQGISEVVISLILECYIHPLGGAHPRNADSIG